MKHLIEIELDPYLEDSVDNAVSEIEEAVENIRKYQPKDVSTTVEVDLLDLLAEHKSIALIWETGQLLSRLDHLTEDQAWEVLKECERNYKGEEGLSWGMIERTASEMFPAPAERLRERVDRFETAVTNYNGDGPGTDNLVDLLADARHWCDAKELDFSWINGQAYEHYLTERDGKE